MAAAPTQGTAPAGAPPAAAPATSVPPEWLSRLRKAWDGELRPSVRRAVAALLSLGLVGAALIARIGTLRARVLAASLLGAVVVLAIGRAVASARGRRD